MQEEDVTRVFGPPGTGKTTYLLNVVDVELQRGISSYDIGYFAFTRKAANEAKDRALSKFPELDPDTDFPWFRTLHSLAYHCLGVTTKDMMRPEHFLEFAKLAGLGIKSEVGEEEYIVNFDNPVLNEINIARIRGEDLRVHYNRSEMKIEWHHFEYVERTYRQYKERNGVMDFTDLLERLLEAPERLPSLESLIIDEAQDLSRLQWKIVSQLARRSKKLFIAGDDDQALYAWAGADVESFLNYGGKVIVLDKSYRVPAKVHTLANSVVSRIRHRQAKSWSPREEQGSIQYYNDVEQVDLSKGEWLVLAATNYMLNGAHEWLKSQGLLFERHGHLSVTQTTLHAVMGWEALRKGKPVSYQVLKTIYKYLGNNVQRGFRTLLGADNEAFYTLNELKEKHGLLTDAIWHVAFVKLAEDTRDYIIAMLRRGTRLAGAVPIKLSTIHGAKGGEADNVLLITDLSSKFAKEYARNPDSVNRILYVGITRTRNTLHIVHPKNIEKGFRL